MSTPAREGETIEGSRTMRNRPYPVLKCSRWGDPSDIRTWADCGKLPAVYDGGEASFFTNLQVSRLSLCSGLFCSVLFVVSVTKSAVWICAAIMPLHCLSMPFSAAAYVVARSLAVLLGLWRHVVCRCECLPLRVRPDRQRSGGDEVSNPGIQRGALCSRQTRARAEGPAPKAERGCDREPGGKRKRPRRP